MPDYNFDAPIPGQSLTMQQGALPMEYPPQFNTPEEGLEYLWDKLTRPKQVTRLILMLKKEVPVEYIVNTVLFEGVIQGKWTVDVAMLMYQVVFWQIEAIAKFKGTKYKLKNPDIKQDEFLDNFVDILDMPAQQVQNSSIFKGLS